MVDPDDGLTLIGAGGGGRVVICDEPALWPPFTEYPSVKGLTLGPEPG